MAGMPREVRSSAPLVTALVLLGCLVIYLASYLALVVPLGVGVTRTPSGGIRVSGSAAAYRSSERLCQRIFWPLEQIDRRVRVADWTEGDATRSFWIDSTQALPFPLER